jgi:hypothetical protein
MMMGNTEKQLNLAQIEPPSGLGGAILEKIELARRRSLLMRRVFSIGADLVSLVAFIGASVTLVQAFRSSGFGSYLSLLLSDGQAVLSFWNEYLYSLAESLPLASIGVCLLSLFLLLASLRYTSNFFNGHHRFARPA